MKTLVSALALLLAVATPVFAGGEIKFKDKEADNTIGGFSHLQYHVAASALKKNSYAARLSEIVIPVAVMENTTVKDLLSFIRSEAKEADPERKGFNLFMKASAKNLSETVTLDLKDVSVVDMLSLIEQTTEVSFVYEKYAVVVIDKPVKSKSNE